MPVISIVMPSMNEEKTIRTCIEKSKKIFGHYGVEGEVIVVDNSSDSTAEIARSMGSRVIESVTGYGNAYITGLANAQGDYIAIADADNTYDLEELPRFLDYLMKGEADFVIGTRLKGDIQEGSMPWLHQYIGNPFLTWLLDRLFTMNISDAHCGMRAFTRDALDRLALKARGMEFASEMVIEAAYKGLRIKEVPITYYRRDAPSKLRSFHDGWRHVRFMMLYRPVPFLFVPGAIVMLIGTLMTTALLLRGSVISLGLHSFILGSMLLIIGAQILSTGSYVKTYGSIHGLYEKKNDNNKLLSYRSLERELLLGSVILVAGISFGLYIVYQWISAGYGTISEIQYAIISMVFVAVGIQVIFGAIFTSMMLLDTDAEE
ncbi:glycosyltransferase family 2 protein [Methanolobus zinderi]|uniref:Glycosyltransferase family 2 protein n=1 Tax=Methanolobus zinderi TaxID=536044 RepID=A0A7D5E6K7_9EURY|nr:glycosyltransferase family 2 protein [Methanolobus zinderi]QLC49953.1 glycosyltransferase family 2 protein [Methanolobus zinderi]